jgi:outer membrane protein insertion porin family
MRTRRAIRWGLAAAVLALLGPSPSARAQEARPNTLAGEGGGETTTDPTPSAVPAATPPPRRLGEYVLEGNLRESEDILRSFLDPVMPIGQPWGDDMQRLVIERLDDLGYHVSLRAESLGESRIRAFLSLEPVTLVRHVDVQIEDDMTIARAIIEDAIFAEDIRRHMRLRPGTAMALDEAGRAEELRKERSRLLDYLRDEGFFDAKVVITAHPDGPHALRLRVRAKTGVAYRVGTVRVVGNREVAAGRIVALFHHERLHVFPRRFHSDQVEKDVVKVVRLYQERGYPGVRVHTDFGRASFKRNKKAVDFTVFIRERRRIEVIFEGHDAFGEMRLRAQLSFDEERAYDDVEMERSAQALRRFYQSEGYFEATVVAERASFRTDDAFDRIVFTVDEGPRLKVKNVSFTGNTALTDGQLQDLIKTRAFPRFGFLVSGGHATSIQLEQDAARILAAYRRRGYADVGVEYDVTRDPRLAGSAPALAAAIVSGAPSDGLHVVFHIDEGMRQRVAEIRFDIRPGARPGADLGSAALDDGALRRIVGLAPGAAFTRATAEADGDQIKRAYFERGFPHAEVETTARPACQGGAAPGPTGCPDGELPGQVVIIHAIDPGRFVRLGRLVLRGNFKTRDWVILEQIDLDPGATFTLTRASNAGSNLRSSGLFSAVRFDFVGLDEAAAEDKVNVVVHVEERYDHTMEYGLGGGWSTDVGLFGELQSSFPHLGGVGLRFDLNLRQGEEVRSIDGKLLVPRWVTRHLLPVGFRLETHGFWKVEQTPRFGELSSLGTSVAASTEGRLGTPWEGWLLALRYDFRLRNRDEELVRVAGPSDDIEQAPVQTFTGALGPQLVLDRRKDERGRLNPLSPAQGFRLELGTQFADRALGGDARFVKIGAKAQQYIKLGDRFLFTHGVRYDHGVPLGGAVLLPEVERFFAGGDTTVRGFEEDSLLTEIIEKDVPPLSGIGQFRVVPAGGNIRFLHNLDLQVRVWDEGPLLDFPWASAIFFDTGLVTNSLDDLELADLRHALGLAFLRMVTPFGAFSFEWAIPVDPQDGDNPKGRFHFNLGFVLK